MSKILTNKMILPPDGATPVCIITSITPMVLSGRECLVCRFKNIHTNHANDIALDMDSAELLLQTVMGISNPEIVPQNELNIVMVNEAFDLFLAMQNGNEDVRAQYEAIRGRLNEKEARQLHNLEQCWEKA